MNPTENPCGLDWYLDNYWNNPTFGKLGVVVEPATGSVLPLKLQIYMAASPAPAAAEPQPTYDRALALED